jgi:flagellar FliL protein
MRRTSLLLLLALALPLFATAKEETTSKDKGKAIYLPLEPSFVVNLQSDARRVHFMQIAVQVMTHNGKVVSAIENNMPPVRDAMIMLLAHQDARTMSDAAGRETVRQAAQSTLQGVLSEIAGIEQGIEAVYFTDFVVQ